MTAALLVAALVSGPAVADTKSQLAAAKAQLRRLIDRISVAQDAEAALQAQANEISSQIDAVQSKIARVQTQIVGIRGDMQDAQKQLARTQQQLDHRAWVAYETGPGFTLEVLLGANSLSDVSDRLAVVNAAARKTPVPPLATWSRSGRTQSSTCASSSRCACRWAAAKCNRTTTRSRQSVLSSILAA